jgi:nitroimidazol reductase NimA-like FMN-containing flavoprotein (pyridoxamine 5'-phosphate oxidase superfamily)
MLVDHGLELLTEEECLELLGTGEVGRVGVTIGALPAIFPVNYRMLDGDVVFRTAPGSKLAAATTGAVVAFEIDDHDRVDRTGWSVLLVGPSEVVHDLAVTMSIVEAMLEPWAGDEGRTSIVRIHPTFVSGRRIARSS